MKTKIVLAFCTVCVLPNISHGAIASAFTGFNLAFVDTTNTPIPLGTGFITAGYFDGLNDLLIPTSDITTIDTAFQQFTGETGVFGFSGFDGFADFATSGERIGAGSPFLGETLYFVFGNGNSLLSSTQLAVFKSEFLFPNDSAAAVDADLSVELGGQNASPGSFIMGTTGGTVEILSSQIQSVVLNEVVPEPSTLLLTAVGALALLRRQR